MQQLSPPQELARKLIQCPSITPHEGGAIDLLEKYLAEIGFICHRLPFGEEQGRVENLFAVYNSPDGALRPHFCFAGHTDVVPPGDEANWQHPPFGGKIADGKLYGRGAVDMKGAVAAFAAGVVAWLQDNKDQFSGRISLLITGDEEGDAIHGTKPVLEWLAAKDMIPDAFLLGEPTNPNIMGEAMKNGRRGSLSCTLTVKGAQGHAAYPYDADNPLPRLLQMLKPLADTEIDDGNEYFQPSTAAITSIDTGNPARNVTPGQVTAMFNIRYSSDHTADSLMAWLSEHFDSVGGEWLAEWHKSADPFVTPIGTLSNIVADAVKKITGHAPQLSTAGGTSDARFISKYADVIEFGLVGKTMHKTDENTDIDDLDKLMTIYQTVLDLYFKASEAK